MENKDEAVTRNPRSDAEGAHQELQAKSPEPANLPDELKATPSAKDGLLGTPDNPHLAAPPSVAPAPIVKATPHEGTGDGRDSNKFDSLGNEKGDPHDENPEPLHGLGPRGTGAPNESLEAEEKRIRERLQEIRSQRGMSNTDQVDSIGNAQHAFKQEEQGHDKHGMRLPDISTGEIVESAPAQIGPRGVGAPPETFHGKRPNGRS